MVLRIFSFFLILSIIFSCDAQETDYSSLSIAEFANVINADEDRQKQREVFNEINNLSNELLFTSTEAFSDESYMQLLYTESKQDAKNILVAHNYPAANADQLAQKYFELAEAVRSFENKFQAQIDSYSEENQLALRKLTPVTLDVIDEDELSKALLNN